jgi:hypothetical protein
MASTSNPFKQMVISKFTSVNYKDWAYYMQAVLKAVDLWVICGAATPSHIDCLVSANPATPIDTEQKSIHQWDTADSQTISYLKSYITQVFIEQAIAYVTAAGACLSSQEIWTHLQTIYDIVSATSIFSTFRRQENGALILLSHQYHNWTY